MQRLFDVFAAQMDLVAADTAVKTLLGGEHVYLRDSVDLIEQIPGVYPSTPIVAPMEETEASAEITWDLWHTDLDKVLQLEVALKGLLHCEVLTAFGTPPIHAYSEFVSSAPFPGDDRADVVRRIVTTRIRVVRQRAA